MSCCRSRLHQRASPRGVRERRPKRNRLLTPSSLRAHLFRFADPSPLRFLLFFREQSVSAFFLYSLVWTLAPRCECYRESRADAACLPCRGGVYHALS